MEKSGTPVSESEARRLVIAAGKIRHPLSTADAIIFARAFTAILEKNYPKALVIEDHIGGSLIDEKFDLVSVFKLMHERHHIIVINGDDLKEA